tara:strand:- start:7995 stop:8339 length:345 start_codon:yes stop_codon:yes gene_type:complete
MKLKIEIEMKDKDVFSLLKQMMDKIRIEPRPILVPTNESKSDFVKTQPEYKPQEELVEVIEERPTCMDEAGMPTKFKNRCSICGEIGRNARSHRDTMRNGTYHWVLRPGESEEE